MAGSEQDRRAGAPLEVLSEQVSDGVRVRVSGEIDLHTAAKVTFALLSAEEADPSWITLDLSGVRFLDSRGVWTLMQATIRARDNGHRLRILPSAPVDRVIDLCGLRDRLPIEES